MSHYMTNSIDVFDGTTWQNVWTDPNGTQDPGWTYVDYDVTKYANPAMQVRFGFEIQDLAVSEVSSWNIDDVIVASASCP
jgi:hypothetical protein